MFVEWITALQIVVETGLIGRQANGAVTVTDGETVREVCSSSIDP
jgi:polyribonucleotide nucleotidyltransferase